MYRIRPNGYITRLSDLASIPPDPLNRDYRKYLEDVKNGAGVEVEAPLPPVKDRQTRLTELVARSKGDLSRATDLASVKQVVANLLDGLAGLDS